MAAPDAPPAPLTVWLTDRSRYKLGTGRCGAARYLSYHFGPTGYGITAKAESVPLTTGLSAHEGIEAFATILQQHDRLPTQEETRAIITEVQATYLAKVTARGFRGIVAGPSTDETIQEQCVLISGLLWAIRIKFLPWLHQSYRVVLVEQERAHMLSCTCAAGQAAPFDLHVARGCEGSVLMLRTDLLAQRRTGGGLAYFEIKTTGWDSDAWAEQWETDFQLALGTIDVKQTYGEEVTELYIVGLGKGSRKKDKYAGEAEGVTPMRRQQTALCYGYYKPGAPPLAADQWLPAWEWVDEHGETKRANKSFKRRGVWHLKDSDNPTWLAYHQQDPEMSPEEYWVRTLPLSVLDKVCFVLGPLNRQDHQIEATRQGMIGEEDRWREVLWALYEIQANGYSWASEEFQKEYARLVPKSWACRPFGADHQCEHVGICHRHEGWQDPIGSGRYQPRRPHHSFELQQAIARGLLIEDAAEVAEEEER